MLVGSFEVNIRHSILECKTEVCTILRFGHQGEQLCLISLFSLALPCFLPSCFSAFSLLNCLSVSLYPSCFISRSVSVPA